MQPQSNKVAEMDWQGSPDRCWMLWGDSTVRMDVDPPAIAAALVGAPVAVGMASRPPSGKTEIVAAVHPGE
jgi:hypothetical protein